MGTYLCEVFSGHGANLIAGVSSLVAPVTPARVIAAVGVINVLVANLSIEAPITPAAEVSETERRNVFATLVDPVPRLFLAVPPQMIARRSGKILIIGRASALQDIKRASTYSATKGAQIAKENFRYLIDISYHRRPQFGTILGHTSDYPLKNQKWSIY